MTELVATGGAVHAELAVLRGACAGPVLDPTDPRVVAEIAGFSLAVEHAPVAVVGATSSADVAAAVRWAAVRGIPVGVIATGHGGWSHRDTLIVSTRRMDAVAIDPDRRSATVGAGVRWRQVLRAAAPHGLAGLCGSSTGVGVVGYTLGGGVGPLARRHGYACDRVRRLRVVLGDAQILDVTADSDPELFWALLGGKDVAGIVTEMEFELVDVTRLYGGGVFFDGADAAAVMHRWRSWAPALPEDTTTSLALLRVPDTVAVAAPLRGRTVVHLRVAHLGDAASGAALLAPMRDVAAPILDTVADMAVTDVDAIHLDPPAPAPSWQTGAYLTSVEEGTVDRLLEVAGPQHDLPPALVELRQVDGAASRGTSGCLGRQDARFVLGVSRTPNPRPCDVVPGVAPGVVDALAPWATGRLPVNWMSAESAAARPGAAWTRADRERLAGIAARVDPIGVLGADRLRL